MTPSPLPTALYVVATPIGCLEDISLRALRVLASVCAIACEDTRHFRHLADHYNIATPLFPLHEHNEKEASAQVVAMLDKGEAVALVSDAGTPCLSDPGSMCVKAVRMAGHKIIPLPGASALTTALAAAGVGEDNFLFLGFLPAKPKARQTLLHSLAHSPWALVFYEAPHRVVETIADLRAIFSPHRQLIIARELTKSYEEILHLSLAKAQEHFSNHTPRGEFVLLLAAEVPDYPLPSEQAALVLSLLLPHLPSSQSAAIASRLTGVARDTLYRLATELRNKAIEDK